MCVYFFTASPELYRDKAKQILYRKPETEEPEKSFIFTEKGIFYPEFVAPP